MKKHFTILFVLFLILCLYSGCGNSQYAREREAEKEVIYQQAYEKGYEEGYRAAMNAAPKEIEACVDDDIWDLEYDIKEAHGFYPEHAMNTLTNYADGEPVSESDLIEAIWAIRQYYWGVNHIMKNIGDYWID